MGLQIILPEHGEIVKIAKSNIAHVYINEFGAVKIDGEPTEVNLIADRTRDMLVENDSLVFSIKTNPEAKYESMIKVFDKLKHGGADRISFAPRDVIKP
jgi:biopolymer transport protein ExbD